MRRRDPQSKIGTKVELVNQILGSPGMTLFSSWNFTFGVDSRPNSKNENKDAWKGEPNSWKCKWFNFQDVSLRFSPLDPARAIPRIKLRPTCSTFSYFIIYYLYNFWIINIKLWKYKIWIWNPFTNNFINMKLKEIKLFVKDSQFIILCGQWVSSRARINPHQP